MPISCHFRDYKALLGASLAHVSGAITSGQTFTFTFVANATAAVVSSVDPEISPPNFMKISPVLTKIM